MAGTPKVHACCDCGDCRALLDVPYHSVIAWEPDKCGIALGEEHAVEYNYPTLEMTRLFCKHCGETVYNINAMGWRLISQLLIRKCNDDKLPAELQSNAHFCDDRRIVNFDDQLPKG